MAVNRNMTKGARFSFYSMLFLMGSVFWITAMTGHFRMHPEVYGSAVDLPAILWAGLMLFPSGAYLPCLFVNGRRWWTVHVRLVVGLWMITYFSAFFFAALPTAYGDFMVIASAVMAVKALIMVAFDALDLKRQRCGWI